MKQLRIIPSGAQFWFKHIITVAGNYIAYCSTMAIYIIRLSDFKAHKVLVAHDQHFISIVANVSDPRYLASVSADGTIILWDVDNERIENKTMVTGGLPILVEFIPSETHSLLILMENGNLRTLDMKTSKSEMLFNIENARIIRWNVHAVGRMALGGEDGRVVVHTLKKPKTTKLTLKKEPVEDVQWDPNSPNYLLASWKDGTMSLIDADSEQEMQAFDRQGAGVNCIAWLKSIPGGFVTCNEKIAAVRVWNVSNKSPIATVKVGNTGLMNIMSLNPTNYDKEGLFCAFKNGAIGVFNYTKKKLEFLSQPSHAETIFETAFKPNDKNLMATASYDGTIKLWNVDGMECKQTLMKSNQQIPIHTREFSNVRKYVVYSLSWHPGNDNRLVSVNSNGEVLLWNTEKGRLISEITPGTNNPIYRCDWNPLSASLIATGSSDNLAYIFTVDSKGLNLQKKIKHPAVVYGVAWSPFYKDYLATGCNDGNVRVYDCSKAPEVLLKTFSGHTARIFNVSWSPLIPTLLASGSDDNAVRVWDMKDPKCITLVGHTNKVRAVSWNTEVPWLLFSGAWDSKIRMWDLREAKCIHLANEHHADVYGIATHPERPFMYVSCSRDTSIRFWTIERLVASLQLRLIVTNDWEDVLGEAVSSFTGTAGKFKFCGKVSKKIAAETRNLGQKDLIERFERLTAFFCYLDYQAEFWDLIKVLVQGKVEEAKNRVAYYKNLPALYLSKAQELESSTSQGGYSYDSLNKKSDRILEASKLYLKLGEFEYYCESLVKLGMWEKALAFAPAVSKEYWQHLSKRYAEHLASEENEDSYIGHILAGQPEEAVKFLVNRGDYEDAKLVATLKLMGKYDPSTAASKEAGKAGQPPRANPKSDETNESLREIIDNLSEQYLIQGNSILAACSHLSINDPNSAVIKLIRANEVTFAYATAIIFKLPILNYVSWMLAKKAERFSERYLGHQLFKEINATPLLALYCASNVDAGTNNVEDLYKQNGLENVSCYSSDGDKYLAKRDYTNAVYSYVVGKSPMKAAETAVAFAHECLEKRNYMELPAAIDCFELLPNTDIKSLEGSLKKQVLIYAVYFGFKKATWKGLYPVIYGFHKTLRKLLKTNADAKFPVDINTVKLDYLSAIARAQPDLAHKKLSKLLNVLKDESLKSSCLSLMKNITTFVQEAHQKTALRELNKNTVVISGSDLPTPANTDLAMVSVFSKQLIKAEGYAYEDNRTISTLEEALMWASGTLISPLVTGQAINPY